MSDNSIVLTCTRQGCGHRRSVPSSAFHGHTIRWVRCHKCGQRSIAPHVRAPKRSGLPLLLAGAGGLAVVVVIGVAVAMNVRPAPAPNPVASPGDDPVAATKAALEKARSHKSDIEQNLAQLLPAIDRFRGERRDLTGRLAALDVKRSSDLKDNPRAQPIAKELVELVGQLNLMEKKQRSYEQTEIELDSLIRRLDRKLVIDQLGLSLEELQEVTNTLDSIDVKIQTAEEDAGSALSPLEADAAIDELLGKPAS